MNSSQIMIKRCLAMMNAVHCEAWQYVYFWVLSDTIFVLYHTEDRNCNQYSVVRCSSVDGLVAFLVTGCEHINLRSTVHIYCSTNYSPDVLYVAIISCNHHTILIASINKHHNIQSSQSTKVVSLISLHRDLYYLTTVLHRLLIDHLLVPDHDHGTICRRNWGEQNTWHVQETFENVLIQASLWTMTLIYLLYYAYINFIFYFSWITLVTVAAIYKLFSWIELIPLELSPYLLEPGGTFQSKNSWYPCMCVVLVVGTWLLGGRHYPEVWGDYEFLYTLNWNKNLSFDFSSKPSLNSVDTIFMSLFDDWPRQFFICSSFVSIPDKIIVVTEDDHRILTANELNKIDMSSFQLINSIDPSPTFLDSLLREDCITQRHRNRIDVQPMPNDKNKELLSIVRRRSYEDFKAFKHVIRATQKDGMIIKLLEQGSGMYTWIRNAINFDFLHCSELICSRKRREIWTCEQV